MTQAHITKVNIKPSRCNFNTILKFSLSTLLVLICYSATAKEYYRWHDKDGNLHFTDKPPRGGSKFSTLKGSNRATDQVDEENLEKEANSPLALANKQRCEKEKKRLNTLQSNNSIRMKNADGTSHLLSKEDIMVAVAQSKKAMSVYCK